MGTLGSKKRLKLILSVPTPICNSSHINDPVSAQMSVIDHLGGKIFTYKTTWCSVILRRSIKQATVPHQYFNFAVLSPNCKPICFCLHYDRLPKSCISTSLTADQGNHTLAGRCGYSGEHQTRPHIRTMTDVVPLRSWCNSQMTVFSSHTHRLTAGRLVAPVRAVQVAIALPHIRDAPAVPTLELRLLTFYLGSCEAERGGVSGLLQSAL